MELTEKQRAALAKGTLGYIEQLERTIKAQQEEIAALTGGIKPEDTDTIVDRHVAMFQPGGAPLPVRKGAEIQFKIGDGFGETITAQVIDRGDGPVIEVQGERNMIVDPQSSNVVHIRALGVPAAYNFKRS